MEWRPGTFRNPRLAQLTEANPHEDNQFNIAKDEGRIQLLISVSDYMFFSWILFGHILLLLLLYQSKAKLGK